ncbi:hypothetical protein U9M48_039287 [Paspalum notatum var. saurae]|uniref:Uncharacterized protein n=1 Tax=Paspalum notatum var. saurae TaxID=547442 RepID=A0AAQ3UL38_PASNO
MEQRNHAAAFPTDIAALEIHDAHHEVVVAVAAGLAARPHNHAVPPPSTAYHSPLAAPATNLVGAALSPFCSCSTSPRR